MTGEDLKTTRLAHSLTQVGAAKKLGVTQAYLSMVERGVREVSSELATKAARFFDVPATALPLEGYLPRKRSADQFKMQLGALGYPGFAYLRPRARSNPAELLMEALDMDDLDSRVVEALPWVPLAYPQLDWDWLTLHAKVHDRQNRLGFVLTLAEQSAARQGALDRALRLAQQRQALERSRLVVEDTLCKESMTQAERRWLRTHRPTTAAHWNLLSDLTVEQLPHAHV
jgi:transcriptional regulator with XRE-family HTH domain